ncbi:MAG: 2-hydroxyacyl-CoA dehydratase [Deltaproteobacteria bacterium]|nr:2-hydroxyacyl-CoA dehydratase [Deltaproteobacteria bacterium]MBW2345108.1 2-hydroxyacyl-CoA dehydratase [Deltaproteobacteria bacterium]
MGAFEELAEVSGTLENSYVKAWKSQGKKVIGYVCSYVPEEIFYAADILPYRITGKGVSDTARADAYLSRVNCSFSRCVLEAGFTGRFDFLDGAVFMNGCEHIRRAYENWEATDKALPFMYMLPVPHVMDPDGDALKWYREEVDKLIQAVEGYFDITIEPQNLAEATAVCNESRRLIRKIYDMRTKDNPPFTGAEVLTIVTAGTRMPKTEFNRILAAIIEEAGSRKAAGEDKVRLLVAGSPMDDPDFIENVEEMGAVVVADTLCIGARSNWDLVEENGDPLEAVTHRYFHHVPCPRMAGEFQKRFDFLKKQIDRAQVDGVILESIKFCDYHAGDNALYRRELEQAGIPALELERQYGPLADAGRIRTRVQAFIERIGR